jgi:hypothetical protein
MISEKPEYAVPTGFGSVASGYARRLARFTDMEGQFWPITPG